MLAIMLLFFSNCAINTKVKKHSLLTSKSLVGVWNQVMPLKNSNKVLLTGNFKFINPDGTFYTMVFVDPSGRGLRITPNIYTSITMYGTYEITSKSTFTEQIEKHFINSKMSGTQSMLKYRMLSEDKMQIEYKNPVTGTWVPEWWMRVKPFKFSKTNTSSATSICTVESLCTFPERIALESSFRTCR